MRVAFFGSEPGEKEHLKEKLDGIADAVFYDSKIDKDHLPDKRDFKVISVFTDSHIDRNVMESLPDLKFITTRSTGFDHIDLEAAAERGIKIANVPAYGTTTVAEYTFALILAVSRKITQAYERVREEGRFSVDGLRGIDLFGKTLGVVGAGRIGSHVIKIARGFGMNVIAFDKSPNHDFAKEHTFKHAELDEVLSNSDIVTIHLPYTDETHHLINSEKLSLMRKGAILINTARGTIVETEALVKSLKEGHLAGAGLDVLEEEGVIKDEIEFLVSGHPAEHDLRAVLADHILIDMSNVVVTPHNAFNTQEALGRIADTTIENIKSFIEGAPNNLVEKE